MVVRSAGFHQRRNAGLAGGGGGPASTALLHFDGVNGGTVFTDVKGHTFSVQGGTPTTSTSQFKFGTASLTGPTTSAITSPASADWQFPGDFTVDCWVFQPDITTARDIIGIGAPAVGIILRATGSGTFSFYRGADHAGGTCVANTWQHVAAVRSGSTCSLYVNGTSVASFTNSSTLGDNTTTLTIPYSTTFGQGGNGMFVDEMRIIKGTAAWTSNFTPPTAAYTN
jgi:concanavalin A-like lectin/glucanase superfamily protein